MYEDQLIWSGIEQDDISNIYNYLKEIALNTENESNLPRYTSLHSKIDFSLIFFKKDL